MKVYKVLFFLTITFLWSWINWLIGLHYLSHGVNDDTINHFVKFFFIGVYGPAISAIITTLFFSGFYGIRDLFKRLITWKVPIKIYLFIIFLPLIVIIFGIGLYGLFIGRIGSVYGNAIFAIPGILWASLFAGPLGEELGWRGVLLPELQKKFSAFKSSLIIGPIWFCWHIPLFFAPFGTLVSGTPLSLFTLLTYLVFVISLSCINTWLVNNSKGSVLIAILFHLSVNAGIALLFFPDLSDHYKELYLLATPALVLFTVWIGVRTGFDKKNEYR